MNATQDKRQGLRAEDDRPGFAYLNTDRGLAIACKAFSKTEAEIEAIVGRYSRGKRKGLLRGAIQWRKILRGGWVSGFGVVERGLEYGHSITNWDGEVLFGYNANQDSRSSAIAIATDLAHPEAAAARKKAEMEEGARLERESVDREIARMQESLDQEERDFIVAAIERDALDVSTFEKYLEVERMLTKEFNRGRRELRKAAALGVD